jgi:four helix bundle protein
MDEKTFKERTRRFGLSIIQLVETLPRNGTAEILGRQLLRAGTSVGANYRAACRGRSPSDVIAKLGIVEEEADESIYWMELLVEGHLVAADRINAVIKEANEIVAMTVASIKTLRNRNQRVACTRDVPEHTRRGTES